MNDKEIHDNYLQLIKETEKTLKTCPFCGGMVEMFETEEGSGYDKSLVVRIQCKDDSCGQYKDRGLIYPRWSEMPYDKLMKKNCKIVLELANKWNRRVQ